MVVCAELFKDNTDAKCKAQQQCTKFNKYTKLEWIEKVLKQARVVHDIKLQ